MKIILHKKFWFIVVLFVVGMLAGLLFWKEGWNHDIKQMTPSQIVALEISAYISGNREILRDIIYFPPEMSEVEITQKLSTYVADPTEKTLRLLYCEKVEYSRIIDSNTAEVGTIVTGRWFMFWVARRPFRQIVLKKNNGAWKINHFTDSYSVSDLREIHKRNPEETNTYYLLGIHMYTSNPMRSLRCLKRYKELNPKGFWVSKHLQIMIESLEKIDFSKEETRIYEEGKLYAVNELSWLPQYAYLARMFWELGNKEKVEYYLTLGSNIYEKNPKSWKTLGARRFIEAKNEIEDEMKIGTSGAEFY